MKLFSRINQLRGKLPAKGEHILVSYPKSGRTWIRFALSQFNIGIFATHAGTETNWRDIGRPYTNVAPELKNAPLIFLHRDPIDTAVSMYYQVHKRDLRRWSKRWFRMFIPLALRGALPPSDINSFVLHPCYGVPKISRFNRAWLDYLEPRKDCLIVKYESLRADPELQFQSILDFYGITHATGKELAEASTFDKMKKAEITSNRTGILKSRTKKIPDQNALKVRKGIVGGYECELNSETINKCQMIMNDYGFTPLRKR